MKVFLFLLMAAVFSPASFAQISNNIATTEQKISAAKKFVSETAAQQGFSLVDGSIDLYSSNGLLAAAKFVPDFGYSIVHLETSGKSMEIEYVNFLVKNNAGKIFKGFVYVGTTRTEDGYGDGEANTVNPLTGRKSFVQMSGSMINVDDSLNLSEVK